ncbi:MAG: nucleotide exchange factor GrpE [Pseudomonadota bacterium]
MTDTQPKKTVDQDINALEVEEITEAPQSFAEKFGGGATAAAADDGASDLADENTELKNQILRLAAELENNRRRSDKEVADASKFALGNFAKELAGAIDNLFLITDSTDSNSFNKNQAATNLYQGIELTQKELIKVIEKFGIKRLVPNIGDAFDHNLHQAITQEQTNDIAEGCIARVIQPGYMLHERLIKPCLVAVANA